MKRLIIAFLICIVSCNSTNSVKSGVAEPEVPSLADTARVSEPLVDEMPTDTVKASNVELEDKYDCYKYDNMVMKVDKKTGALITLIETIGNDDYLRYEDYDRKFSIFAYDIKPSDEFVDIGDGIKAKFKYTSTCIQKYQGYCVGKGTYLFDDSLIIDAYSIGIWKFFDDSGYISEINIEKGTYDDILPPKPSETSTINNVLSVKCQYDENNMLSSVEFYFLDQILYKYVFDKIEYVRYSNIKENTDDTGYKYIADVYSRQDIRANAEYSGNLLEGIGTAYSDNLSFKYYYIGYWKFITDGKDVKELFYSEPKGY